VEQRLRTGSFTPVHGWPCSVEGVKSISCCFCQRRGIACWPATCLPAVQLTVSELPRFPELLADLEAQPEAWNPLLEQLLQGGPSAGRVEDELSIDVNVRGLLSTAALQ